MVESGKWVHSPDCSWRHHCVSQAPPFPVRHFLSLARLDLNLDCPFCPWRALRLSESAESGKPPLCGWRGGQGLRTPLLPLFSPWFWFPFVLMAVDAVIWQYFPRVKVTNCCLKDNGFSICFICKMLNITTGLWLAIKTLKLECLSKRILDDFHITNEENFLSCCLLYILVFEAIRLTFLSYILSECFIVFNNNSAFVLCWQNSWK